MTENLPIPVASLAVVVVAAAAALLPACVVAPVLFLCTRRMRLSVFLCVFLVGLAREGARGSTGGEVGGEVAVQPTFGGVTK